MDGLLLVYLFFLHFIADGPLQSREMGRKKSDSVTYLAAHVLIQYLTFLGGLMLAYKYTTLIPGDSNQERQLFVKGLPLANAIVHGLVDLVMWKGYKLSVALRKPKHLFGRPTEGSALMFKFWEDSWFFHTILLDQFFHLSTIVLITELAIKL